MSQCDAILAVLRDGEWHTIQEIHAVVGPCRLNSRIAELRDPAKKWKRDIKSHRETVHGLRGPTTIYRYRDFGPLDSEAVASGGAGAAASASSAGGASQATLPPASFAGPTLDEYGVDRAAAELNAAFPGMLLEDGVPVAHALPIEDQRVEIAKLQQTLWGQAA